MDSISVYDGEYEYLMMTDPNFRKFVEECEGKSLQQIIDEHNIVTNFVTSDSIKEPLNVQNTFDM